MIMICILVTLLEIFPEWKTHFLAYVFWTIDLYRHIFQVMRYGHRILFFIIIGGLIISSVITYYIYKHFSVWKKSFSTYISKLFYFYGAKFYINRYGNKAFLFTVGGTILLFPLVFLIYKMFPIYLTQDGLVTYFSSVGSMIGGIRILTVTIYSFIIQSAISYTSVGFLKAVTSDRINLTIIALVGGIAILNFLASFGNYGLDLSNSIPQSIPAYFPAISIYLICFIFLIVFFMFYRTYTIISPNTLANKVLYDIKRLVDLGVRMNALRDKILGFAQNKENQAYLSQYTRNAKDYFDFSKQKIEMLFDYFDKLIESKDRSLGFSILGVVERAVSYYMEHKRNVNLVFNASAGLESLLSPQSTDDRFMSKIMERFEEIILNFAKANIIAGLVSARVAITNIIIQSYSLSYVNLDGSPATNTDYTIPNNMLFYYNKILEKSIATGNLEAVFQMNEGYSSLLHAVIKHKNYTSFHYIGNALSAINLYALKTSQIDLIKTSRSINTIILNLSFVMHQDHYIYLPKDTIKDLLKTISDNVILIHGIKFLSYSTLKSGNLSSVSQDIAGLGYKDVELFYEYLKDFHESFATYLPLIEQSIRDQDGVAENYLEIIDNFRYILRSLSDKKIDISGANMRMQYFQDNIEKRFLAIISKVGYTGEVKKTLIRWVSQSYNTLSSSLSDKFNFFHESLLHNMVFGLLVAFKNNDFDMLDKMKDFLINMLKLCMERGNYWDVRDILEITVLLGVFYIESKKDFLKMYEEFGIAIEQTINLRIKSADIKVNRDYFIGNILNTMHFDEIINSNRDTMFMARNSIILLHTNLFGIKEKIEKTAAILIAHITKVIQATTPTEE